jgi:hypothetical protein
MEDMDAMFYRFVDTFQGTSNHSAGLKEAVELYKSRSKVAHQPMDPM